MAETTREQHPVEVSRPVTATPFPLIAVFWTLTIFAMAGWSFFETYRSALSNAASAARIGFSKDVHYRQWNTRHGSVYVPISEYGTPNPYLAHLQERDVMTSDGLPLTLINPGYMTRQAHEITDAITGIRSNITSLKTLRPENAPDNWEQRALRAFELGVPEYSSLDSIEGKVYLRLMQPLLVDNSCLRCHAHQGYQIGDVRGGISVSIPWVPYRESILSKLPFFIISFGGIWVVGLAAARYGFDRMQQQIQREHHLERKRFETLLHAEQDRKNAQIRLLVDLAHQWRQPLNVIGLSMQNLEMIALDAKADKAKIPEIVGSAMERLEGLSHTITRMTGLYESADTIAPVSIAEACDTASSQIRSQCGAPGLTVSNCIPPNLTQLASSFDLVEMFISLFSNVLTIAEKRNIATPTLTIKARDISKGKVEVSVCDNVGGIEDSQLSDLFSPYTTSHFRSEGKGLGLYFLSRKVEEIYQGHVQARNCGSGACIVIILGAHKDADHPALMKSSGGAHS